MTKPAGGLRTDGAREQEGAPSCSGDHDLKLQESAAEAACTLKWEFPIITGLYSGPKIVRLLL